MERQAATSRQDQHQILTISTDVIAIGMTLANPCLASFGRLVLAPLHFHQTNGYLVCTLSPSLNPQP